MTRSHIVIAVLSLAVLAAAYVAVGPVAQDPAYHDFADARPWLGIPRFGDVMSNAGLVIVGAWGLSVLARRKHAPFTQRWELRAQLIFHGGVFLAGFGSAYYHWAPSDATLVWDRLPMTFFFMGLFALVIGERVSMDLGRRLLAPLVIAGVASVLWWSMTESAGHGDLRPYALVQFVPVLTIPLLLWKRTGVYTHTKELFLAVAWYGVAKVFEALDRPIFDLTGAVSGHTLKHLASAVGAAYVGVNLVRRRVRDA